MRFFYLLLVCVIITISGCVDHNRIESKASAYANKIHFNNDIPISIQSFNVRKNTNGLLEFELVMVGTTHKGQKTIAYKIDWLDKDGFVLPATQSDYKKITLEPNRVFMLRQTATNQHTADFKIYFEYFIKK